MEWWTYCPHCGRVGSHLPAHYHFVQVSTCSPLLSAAIIYVHSVSLSVNCIVNFLCSNSSWFIATVCSCGSNPERMSLKFLSTCGEINFEC